MTLPRRLSYEDIAQTDPFMIEVIEVLSSLVHKQELYLVGGFLRDFMLGNPARDADFVSSRNPGTLAGEAAVRFGGKRFTIKEEQDIHRVTLHYEDRVYTLDFSPIKGKSLEEDLSLRDFTINAMALDVWSFALQREAILPRDLIDKHYGWRDLSHRVLRECNKESFLQDPVRVLRAMRFQRLLDMEVEERTLNHIKKYASLITQAPGERIAAEVLETLSYPGASTIFDYLQNNGILYYVFPALAPLAGLPQNYYHHLDAWKHTLLALDELDRLMERPEERYPGHAVMIREHLRKPLQNNCSRGAMLRLAALFHDTGKAQTFSRDEAERIHFNGHTEYSVREVAGLAEHLRLSRRSGDFLTRVVSNHMRIASSVAGGVTPKGTIRLARKLGEETVDVVLLSTADRLATLGEASTPEDLEAFMDLCAELLEQYEHDAALEPLLSGGDLLASLGLEPGELIGSLLREVREAQLEGKVGNREEALEWAKAHLETDGAEEKDKRGEEGGDIDVGAVRD
jgi:poly(A) polymerase